MFKDEKLKNPEAYDRIASAIGYIRAHIHQQPSLADIANSVHLSPFHFQRLFSRWSGVTPKKFLQILTLEQAKTLLTDAQCPIMEASYQLGLSSASRLYDHFVQLNAVTPKEFKEQGWRLDIEYGVHASPFGTVFIAVTERGICQLTFLDDIAATHSCIENLQNQWQAATIKLNQRTTAAYVARLFDLNGSASTQPLSLLVKGTNFQIMVWRALLNIPQGQLCSYSQLAQAIDRPKGARAIGTAIGANPLAFVIPCHRVIQKNGHLGGYRWGLIRKHAMLVHELSQGEA